MATRGLLHQSQRVDTPALYRALLLYRSAMRHSLGHARIIFMLIINDLLNYHHSPHRLTLPYRMPPVCAPLLPVLLAALISFAAAQSKLMKRLMTANNSSSCNLNRMQRSSTIRNMRELLLQLARFISLNNQLHRHSLFNEDFVG